jgi:hypothetical protein
MEIGLRIDFDLNKKDFDIDFLLKVDILQYLESNCLANKYYGIMYINELNLTVLGEKILTLFQR